MAKEKSQKFNVKKAIIFCFLFSSCAHINHVYEQGNAMKELPLEILREEEDSGRIFTTGQVDGQTERFYIDTGANNTKIKTNKIFENYKAIESKSLMGLSGKPITLSKIRVQNILMGAFSTSNHEVLRYPNTPDFESTAGIDLLQNKIFGFEFSKNKIIELDKLNATDKFVLTPRGYILLHTHISGHEINGIWDTGAGLTTIDTEFVKKNPDLFTFVKDIDGGDTTGSSLKMKLYMVKKIQIGSMTLENVQFLAYDFSPIRTKLNDPTINMAIGFNILIHHDWYFDMKNHTWTAK